jgi:hypothetical protein
VLLERRYRADVIGASDGAPLIRLAGERRVANDDAQRRIDQIRDGA